MSWRNCARGGKGKHYKQGTKRSKYLCSITNRGVRYIEILIIDISTLCENINIDKVILENIDIDKDNPENIDTGLLSLKDILKILISISIRTFLVNKSIFQKIVYLPCIFYEMSISIVDILAFVEISIKY